MILETTEIKWELWYQDVFDRETPRQVEKSGSGLVAGLMELWLHHLGEAIIADGRVGCSRFNLWLKRDRISIRIMGEGEGLVKLREWIFSEHESSGHRLRQGADHELLQAIVEIHNRLLRVGETNKKIVNLAATSRSRKDFEERLAAFMP